MVANGTKIVDKASEWLLNQSIKYAEILASEKATLPKKKNAQRELAGIFAAVQILELTRKRLRPAVRQADIAFPTPRPTPNPEDL
jgi:hypothetical protein